MYSESAATPPAHPPVVTLLRFVCLRKQTHLGVVGRLFDDLGRHPEGRAHEGVALDLRVRQLSRHAEVG